ncbi:MAG: tetratricopeptide repeat protein, partial [Dehalococcoidia bacterium]
TLALELSAVRQARLHQHIGEALEELYGGDGEDHAAELAYHFAEAAAVIGSEKLVKYSLLAGERALATYAHEEALIYFDRGLLAKEGQPMDAETAALLCGLGHAQTATLERHQLHDAVSSLRRAFDYYAEVENVNLAVAVAQFPVNSAPGQRTGLAQLIGDALKLVPPESLEAGHLLSRYGRVLGIEEGNYEGAEEALGRALTIAQQEGDAALEMWTLANSAQVALYDLRFQEALEKGLRAIELAQKANDPRAEVFARFYASAVLRRIGDLPGWRQQTSAMVAPAERLRDRYWLIGVYESQGHLLRIEGQWQAARDVYDRGLAVSPREPRLLARRALLEYEEGEFGQGEAFLRRLIEAMGMTAPGPALVYGYTAVVIGFAARITGMVDRFDVAQTAAETVLSSAHVNPNYAMQARAGLALLAVQRGDVRAAREQYESLKSMQGLGLYSGFICFDHLLGLLAHAMGNLDQATAHFEDTLAFCRKAGYRPELAWTCCDYADALFQRDGRGDHMQAMSLLEESLSISSELGMRPLLARVQERLDRTESQPGPSPEYPDGLTPREVEVLCLIARGRSNRELAAELVLSLRTVERHITNIYGKISARGRADATAYVLGHDLIDQK